MKINVMKIDDYYEPGLNFDPTNWSIGYEYTQGYHFISLLPFVFAIERSK